VTIPDGATVTIDRDFVIANISAPSSLRSSDNDEEEASEEEEATTDAEETTEEE
jgi:large subunit ribosomal protein L25